MDALKNLWHFGAVGALPRLQKTNQLRQNSDYAEEHMTMFRPVPDPSGSVQPTGENPLRQ
jgi:hypothetical protein